MFIKSREKGHRKGGSVMVETVQSWWRCFWSESLREERGRKINSLKMQQKKVYFLSFRTTKCLKLPVLILEYLMSEDWGCPDRGLIGQKVLVCLMLVWVFVESVGPCLLWVCVYVCVCVHAQCDLFGGQGCFHLSQRGPNDFTSSWPPSHRDTEDEKDGGGRYGSGKVNIIFNLLILLDIPPSVLEQVTTVGVSVIKCWMWMSSTPAFTPSVRKKILRLGSKHENHQQDKWVLH